MPYTAKLISVTSDPQYPDVSVSTIEFTDGKETITDVERGLSAQNLVSYCREKIQHLSEQTAIDAYIANPPIGPVETSSPVAPTNPKEDFQSALESLEFEKKKVELLGLDLSTDTAYQNALTIAQGKNTAISSDAQIKP